MLKNEMMARWRIRLSYGPKNEVREVSLTNGIIKGYALSPFLFIFFIDPLIKIIKWRVGADAQVLNSMDNLKDSMDNNETTRTVHEIVSKKHCLCWDGHRREE